MAGKAAGDERALITGSEAGGGGGISLGKGAWDCDTNTGVRRRLVSGRWEPHP